MFFFPSFLILEGEREREIASGCLSVTITVIHNLIILKAWFNKRKIPIFLRLAQFVCFYRNDECLRKKTVDHAQIMLFLLGTWAVFLYFIVKLHFSILYNDDWKLHFLQNITWIMNFKYSAISCLFFLFVFCIMYILHVATSAALYIQKRRRITRGNYLCSVYM